jgi:hypothetical protein
MTDEVFTQDLRNRDDEQNFGGRGASFCDRQRAGEALHVTIVEHAK